MEKTVQYDSPLLEYLYTALAPQSRTSIKALLTSSRISVNGQVTTAYDHMLKAGDRICISRQTRKISVDKRLRVIFEDRWLIVVDKCHGLPAISTGKENEVTAYSLLYKYMKEASRTGRIFIVHRLDRETSGILVFAKDEETKRLLQENWSRIVMERRYTGAAEGCFSEKEGSIVSWLTENPKSLKVHSSPYDNGGKKAVTHYHVTAEKKNYSMVEIELETGRKNQIRAQFASIGHPIAGDRKYGAGSDPFGRLALHASRLVFRHPHTGEIMEFNSPAPFRI